MKKQTLPPKAKESPGPIVVTVTDKKEIYEMLDRWIAIRERLPTGESVTGNPKNTWMFWEWLFVKYPKLSKIPDGRCQIDWYPPVRVVIRQIL